MTAITDYIPAICLFVGIVIGIGVTIIGFKLGFKASYEIRNQKEEPTEGEGLFPKKKDPAEFELVKEDLEKEE